MDGPFSRVPLAKPGPDHIATLWALRAPSGRLLICSAYRTATGLEIRAAYDGTDLVASERYGGPDADERLADAADRWRLTLIEKGFKERD